MELAFATRDLRALCEDFGVAEDVLGAPAAEQLKARLADIRAADNVEELMGLGIPGVTLEDGEVVTIDLSQGYRMVVKSNHEAAVPPEPARAWRRVHRLQVLSIDRAAR